MALKINILSNEFVRPSSPTKDVFKKYQISSLDQIIPPISIPVILYYSHDESSPTTQHDMSSRLRESLSDTLTLFYPLAGRLNKGDNSVDCNDMGVRYIEAKVDSLIMDVIGCDEAIVIDQLIPPMNKIPSEVDEEELFVIQVNYFNCGGIAIGAYIPHKIADGCSYFSFITSWATISRGDIIVVKPSFISSSLFPPKKNFVNQSPQLDLGTESLVTRKFVFIGSQIKTMRAKAKTDHPDMGEPTRVEVVTAFIWKYASGDKLRKEYIASHNVNLRTRMVPPVPEHVFGNLIGLGYAISKFEDSDLAILARNVRDGIKTVNDEAIQMVRGEEGFAMMMEYVENMSELLKSKEVELFRFSSWCRFGVYEADFGMGKPIWASLASVNMKNFALFIDSNSKDGIEAWVTMTEEDMTRFQLAFAEANSSE
ncbi:stemmadenine O-acetyltransferase-like [Impatiens glandulifera]|uniref:stemmadenine O-acetyltransferase-like n=1 Tax=Impatiens glandulifera TaxID=253017 RepID=UPI001FB1419B|nr:stemmadenine O-acetyltransferase-like [Impatiens glandulifera]